MKRLLTLLPVLLLCTCAPASDDSPAIPTTENSVSVYVEGALYYRADNNIFSVIEPSVTSSGIEKFDLLLFATGVNDEEESFAISGDLSSLSNPSSLVGGPHGGSFTQIGNGCSGIVLLDPDSAVEITTANGRSEGIITGKLFDTFATCSTDVRIEFYNIEVID